ncbi:MAG: transglutaminase domain-containing protein, partial [Halodesulfurarchaeum sp.]
RDRFSRSGSFRDRFSRSGSFRHLSLVSITLLTGASLAVLYHVVDVVGGVMAFLLIAGASIGLAVAARSVSRRRALLFAGFLFLGGAGYYLLTMPEARFAMLSIGRVMRDVLSLVTGYSVLRVTNVRNWALAVTAAPTFLVWYFAVRENFVAASTVGVIPLGFFVLTGDSGTVGTTIGTLGAFGAVGFDTLESHGAGRAQGELVVGLFALLLLAAGSVGAAPGTGGPIVPPDRTDPQGDLVTRANHLTVGGGLDLSPTVLFTVESETGAYWRATVYDRFTGRTWIRTGPVESRGKRAEPPPGASRRIEQHVTARRPVEVYPAASKPVRVRGPATITEYGDLDGQGLLRDGEDYFVVSRRPVLSENRLTESSGAYPPSIRNRYLRVPASTPDRVHRLAQEIAGDERDPVQKAVAIEAWLEANKAYSLDVRRPGGNVVDAFLFEMTRGYCVYYATSMVVLLRTQGVPARFVVGYTPGQQVDGDQWVVRGLDSHAWVEVYVREVGWVRFDPTPSGPRRAAERQEIRQARAADLPGVDALGSETEPLGQNGTANGQSNGTTDTSPVGDRNPAPIRRENGTSGARTDSNVTLNGSVPPLDSRRESTSTLPRIRRIGTWLVLAGALAVGFRRTRAGEQVVRFVWLRRLPTGDPEQVVDGVYDRVEYLLERESRPRRSGETVRQYVTEVARDERVKEIAHIRERGRYADGFDETDGDRARNLLREVLSDRVAAFRFFPSTVFNRLLS